MKNKSLKEIKLLIRLIENFQDKDSISNLENYVGYLLDGYPTAYFDFEAISQNDSLDDGYGLYRSRTIKSIEEIRFEHQLWEPPSRHIKLGRMNREQENVLYCSNHLLTTFAELSVNTGEICVATRFEKKIDPELDKLRILPFGENVEKYIKNKNFNEGKLSSIRSQLSKTDKEKYKLITEYLMTVFRKNKLKNDENFYFKSATIANFYKKNLSIHGFFYPSVKAKYGSYNLAFDPLSAKKHFQIKSIQFYEIKNVSNFRYTYKLINQVNAISSSGEIIF